MVEYLKIQNERPYTAKTLQWDVINGEGTRLGQIRWYSPWRKYTYYTTGNYLVLCDNCLSQLSAFCRTATLNHKNANKSNHPKKLQQS